MIRQNNVGKRIKAIRKRFGENQSQFGERFNPTIDKGSVSRWENGKTLPSADKLKKIADFGGVSVNYLLTGASNRLKEIREQKGLSREQLADEYNECIQKNRFIYPNAKKVSSSIIRKWESGQEQPNVDSWENLALLLGVPTSYLKGTSDDKEGWEEWAENTGYSVDEIKNEIERLEKTERIDKSSNIQHKIDFAVKSLSGWLPTSNEGVLSYVSDKLRDIQSTVNKAFMKPRSSDKDNDHKLKIVNTKDYYKDIRSDMDRQLYDKIMDILDNARWSLYK